VRDIKTAEGWERLYQGPEVLPVSSQDILLPADSPSLDEAEHVIQRNWLTINDLLGRERRGIYRGISERMDEIKAGTRYRETEPLGQLNVGDTKIDMSAHSGRKIWIETLECYYQYDMDGDGHAEEWIFTVLKQPRLLVRAVELWQVYPSGQRPFTQFMYKKALKGPYGKGVGQELEDINVEANTILNQMTDVGTISMAGPVMSRAGSLAEEKLNQEEGWYPAMHIPTENPLEDVVFPVLRPHIAFGTQDLDYWLGFGEKMSGVGDVQLGRNPRGGALPRTYGQQLLIQQEGGENLQSVGARFRNSWAQVVDQVHNLNKTYLPEMVFFRVSGERGDDILQFISREDMNGKYDFSIKPVSPARNKQAEQAQKVQAIQFIMPLLDRARVDPGVYKMVKLVWETFGMNKLEEIIGIDDDPVKHEHVAMLQGRRVVATPFDDHQRHMALHFQFAQEALEQGYPGAALAAQSHMQEHVQVSGIGVPQQGGGQQARPGDSPGRELQRNNDVSQQGSTLGGGQGQFVGGRNPLSGQG
jgi:hypothetical protein